MIKKNLQGFGHWGVLLGLVVLAVIGFAAWRIVDMHKPAAPLPRRPASLQLLQLPHR